VIRLNGVTGPEASNAELPENFLTGGAFVSDEPALADRLWVTALWADSILALRAATLPFVDCPRPPGPDRGKIGGGRDGAFLSEDRDEC
jgi:hypothetical protein